MRLLERSRGSVARFFGRPAPRETGSQEVLAGVCSRVALRDLDLVDSLLERLERMESDEDDPDALAQLYELDHLATRLRRNGESLRLLAGRDAGGGRGEPGSLVDVIRAGMSSVEQYARVELGAVAELGVVGSAADDISRLLAELLDNATAHSPSSSAVVVSAHPAEQGGVLVQVEDEGTGLPAARLSALNERLAGGPVLDRNAVQHLGLAVVRRISSRHDLRVRLAGRAPHGTTASVLLPARLVQDVPADHRIASPQRGSAAAEPNPAPGPGPKRDSRPGPTASRVAPAAGTTPSGLPRRVPGNVGEAAARPVPAAGCISRGEHAGHEQLLADLGDFAEGEQTAQQEHQDGRSRNTARPRTDLEQTGREAGDQTEPGTGSDSSTPEGHQK